MIAKSRQKRKGNSMVEFVLVGIPVLFALLSIFDISLGMCTYHSMAYAVREGVRYATVHGKGCASPHTCQVTIGQITSRIRAQGAMLPASITTVTFTAADGSVSSGTMVSQSANSTVWPPSAANAPGQNVKIKVSYPYRTILTALLGGGRGTAVFNLGASSTEPIKF